MVCSYWCECKYQPSTHWFSCLVGINTTVSYIDLEPARLLYNHYVYERSARISNTGKRSHMNCARIQGERGPRSMQGWGWNGISNVQDNKYRCRPYWDHFLRTTTLSLLSDPCWVHLGLSFIQYCPSSDSVSTDNNVHQSVSFDRAASVFLHVSTPCGDPVPLSPIPFNTCLASYNACLQSCCYLHN